MTSLERYLRQAGLALALASAVIGCGTKEEAPPPPTPQSEAGASAAQSALDQNKAMMEQFKQRMQQQSGQNAQPAPGQ